MADNLNLPFTGEGTDLTGTIATDDIGGVHFQRFKVNFGQEGSATDVSDANPLPVEISNNSVVVTETPATASEGAALPTEFVVVAGDDGTDTHPLQIEAGTGGLKVAIVSGGSSGPTAPTIVDGSAFTVSTTNVSPIAGIYKSAGDSVDDGDAGAIRMSENRNLFVSIRDAAGNERGLNIDANGNIGITDAGESLTVDGTVTISDGGGSITVDALSLPLPTGAATAALQTQPGVDIGDVTINNAGGGAAVNIQDGGNTITVDGTVSVTGSTVTVTDGGGALTVDGTVGITGGLPTGANTIGGVTIAAGLPTGANTIGSVGVTAITAGLPTGANTIGSVGVTAITAGLPTGANTIGAVASIVAGLPTGANTIGTVVVSSLTAGLPTGANTIGAVTVSGSVAVTGLPTGANTIGSVGISSGLPTGANTIGAVASIVAGLPTGANTIGSVGVTAITAGLPTGANTIGVVLTTQNMKSTRIDEASNTITYIGYAVPGTANSSAAWTIKRLDSTAGLIILFPNGSSANNQIWDNRAGLTYS